MKKYKVIKIDDELQSLYVELGDIVFFNKFARNGSKYDIYAMWEGVEVGFHFDELEEIM